MTCILPTIPLDETTTTVSRHDLDLFLETVLGRIHIAERSKRIIGRV